MRMYIKLKIWFWAAGFLFKIFITSNSWSVRGLYAWKDTKLALVWYQVSVEMLNAGTSSIDSMYEGDGGQEFMLTGLVMRLLVGLQERNWVLILKEDEQLSICNDSIRLYQNMRASMRGMIWYSIVVEISKSCESVSTHFVQALVLHEYQARRATLGWDNPAPGKHGVFGCCIHRYGEGHDVERLLSNLQ